MAARCLHRIREPIGIKVSGAFEYHVFQKMRNAGAEVIVLVHAASLHPNLRTDYRCSGIWIENQSDPIGQRLDGGGSGWIFHEVLAWIQS